MGLKEGIGMIGSAMAGQFMGDMQDDRDYGNAKRMQRLQIEGQKEMGGFNSQLAKDMWEYTGYKNQIRQMKEANLSPGLMYGLGGGGGQTNSVQSGSVSAGERKGGNEMIEMIKSQPERALLEAQTRNIEADTKLKETDAKKRGGVDTANVEADTGLKIANTGNVNADTKLKEIQQRTDKVEADIAEDTMWEAMDTIRGNQRMIKETVDGLVRNNHIGRETQKEVIDSYKIRNGNMLADTALKIAQKAGEYQGIEESGQRIKKMIHEIVYDWAKHEQEGRKINIAEKVAETDKGFKEALERIGEWNTFINGLEGIIGAGSKVPVGTVPKGGIGFPKH